VVLTLAVVVARARFQAYYLDSLADAFGWTALPLPLAVVAGAAAGWRSGGWLAALTACCFAGAAVGVAAGVGLGGVLSPEPEDRWAGGVIGGAAGLLLGAAAAWGIGRHSGRAAGGAGPFGRGNRWTGRGATLGLLALLACGEDPVVRELPPPAPAPLGQPAEAVLFLVGDLGEARLHHTPILTRLAGDVEAWSARAGAAGSVLVLVLGDVVYPDGMRPPGSDAFWVDSARAADQTEVVLGPHARAAGARMLFLAGNHDWGLAQHREGARQLLNLEEFLDRMSARGAPVDLLPPAGTGGPAVLDAGPFRLILLDTAWWILDAEPVAKAAVIAGVREALRTAGGREVVIAAHHPYLSGGPHGGEIPFWRTLGVRYVLARSGAVLQNLNSRPYKDLVRGLEALFVEHGRPLLFAGGHDHSLQLLAHDDPAAPRFTAVSGSGSKLSPVGSAPGMLFGASEPGYMRVVAWPDGAVDLSVEAAPERFLSCPEVAPEAVLLECMREGVAAFREVLSMRIKER
jgi:hypothetical protein